MKQYVTDTHCLLWYIAQDRRLSRAARAVFEAAERGRAQVLVPTISLVEVVFLVQRRRVPESVLRRLIQMSESEDGNFVLVPLDLAVIQAVAEFGPAVVPELPDRVIAATARMLDLPLLTVDPEIIVSGLVKVLE